MAPLRFPGAILSVKLRDRVRLNATSKQLIQRLASRRDLCYFLPPVEHFDPCDKSRRLTVLEVGVAEEYFLRSCSVEYLLYLGFGNTLNIA